MNIILQWIDLAWLVMAFAIARKDQRAWVFGFFAAGMLMMRLWDEMIVSLGYPDGMLRLISTPVHTRLLLSYSCVYLAYICLIRYSPNAKGTLLMMASILFFFAAFFFGIFVSVL